MENTELRLTPRAVELLEELDEKGLAYEAREDWDQFVRDMSGSEAAGEVRQLLTELQCELIYDQDTQQERPDACAVTDLSWPTLAAVVTAHKAPKGTSVENTTIDEAPMSPADLDDIKQKIADNDQAAKVRLLKDNIQDRLNRSDRLEVQLRGIREQVQGRGLSYRNMVQSRLDEVQSLKARSQAFIEREDASADTGETILNTWKVLWRESNEMEDELRAQAELLKTKDLEFPFPEPREGQLEAATETRDALLNDDVVSCAPTGFGKSAFVLSAVSGFRSGAYVITPQRVLVKQYEDDFKEVPWVGFYKSRASFKCRCEKARSKRKGPPEDWPTCSDFADACSLGAVDEGSGTCPYAVARNEALSKPVVVMTAAMATTMMLYQKQRFPMRSVLAVDECQRFEDTLMSACTTTLKYESLVKDGWTMENDLHGGEPLVWPEDKLDQYEVKEWLQQWAERARQRLEKMDPANLEGKDLKEYRRYDSLVSSLKMAFMFDDPSLPPDKQRPHSWAHEVENPRFNVPESFTVKPLSAIGMLDDIMGGSAARKLLVSATPGTPEYIQDTLGLKSTPAYFEYGSPFPIENRPIVYNPIVRLNYNSSKADEKKITDMIVKIATDESDDKWTNHRHQKGIIHTVSNKLHKIIVDALRAAKQGWRLREVRGSKRRLEIMDEFMKSDEPLIMIGPALTDGVSLKDDQCRWGIIPKLPWPPPVDPSVAYRKDNIPDWYAFQVVLAVIQACGRNVRSKDDWGVNYVLDSGFGSLIQRNQHLFPDWFLEAVVEI